MSRRKHQDGRWLTFTPVRPRVDSRCSICRRQPTKRRGAVEVRALLCTDRVLICSTCAHLLANTVDMQPERDATVVRIVETPAHEAGL